MTAAGPEPGQAAGGAAGRPPRLAAPHPATAALPPAAGRLLGRLGTPVDGALTRVFGSRWNPLHQTGTVAVLAFLVAAATGIYLFLFYKVGAPYQVARCGTADLEVPAGAAAVSRVILELLDRSDLAIEGFLSVVEAQHVRQRPLRAV